MREPLALCVTVCKSGIAGRHGRLTLSSIRRSGSARRVALGWSSAMGAQETWNLQALSSGNAFLKSAAAC